MLSSNIAKFGIQAQKTTGGYLCRKFESVQDGIRRIKLKQHHATPTNNGGTRVACIGGSRVVG